MPVRHFDEIGKLYSEGVKPKTDETLISEQKVGDLPADAFPVSNKDAETDKAFNDAGPEAAENFEVSPNDTNKKKSKKSAYNEELHSQPVVQEKSDEKKLLKGSNKPGKKGKVVAKEGLGDAVKSVAMAPVHVAAGIVKAPWEVAKGVAKGIAAPIKGAYKGAKSLAVAPAQALGYEKP